MKRTRKFVAIIIILLAVFAGREILYNVSYPIAYQDYIVKYSNEYDIDPYLLTAIIKTESSFDRNAASHKGAIGLMQLTESTAQWVAESMGDEDFDVNDLYDPEINIKMGSWYLDNIRKEFAATELVLAAYNAGRGNVASWIDSALISEDGSDLSNIPYEETEKYIQKVLVSREVYKMLYDID